MEIDCINLKVKFKTFCFILPHDVSAEDKNVHWFLRIIIWIEISRRHNAKWNFKVNNGYTNLEFSDAFLFMVILSIYLDTSNLQNKSQWYFFFFKNLSPPRKAIKLKCFGRRGILFSERWTTTVLPLSCTIVAE